jgi:hypothetical protein
MTHSQAGCCTATERGGRAMSQIRVAVLGGDAGLPCPTTCPAGNETKHAICSAISPGAAGLRGCPVLMRPDAAAVDTGSTGVRENVRGQQSANGAEHEIRTHKLIEAGRD